MKIDNLWAKNTKREKILLMITLPLIILIILQLALIQPIENEKKDLSVKIQAAGVEMGELNQKMEKVQQLLAVSSKVKLNKQLESLETQIAEQKKLLKLLTDNLIPPQQMATVVEKMLKQRGKLKLISLINLEPQALPEETEETEEDLAPGTAKQQKNVTLIYRHPLQLKLKGRYFQVMEYLKALEQSGYKFYWEQLDYKVAKYPQAEVLITLSTLGTEPHWMGANNEAD